MAAIGIMPYSAPESGAPANAGEHKTSSRLSIKPFFSGFIGRTITNGHAANNKSLAVLFEVSNTMMVRRAHATGRMQRQRNRQDVSVVERHGHHALTGNVQRLVHFQKDRIRRHEQFRLTRDDEEGIRDRESFINAGNPAFHDRRTEPVGGNGRDASVGRAGIVDGQIGARRDTLCTRDDIGMFNDRSGQHRLMRHDPAGSAHRRRSRRTGGDKNEQRQNACLI
jgi:hypothetical protein